MILYNCSKGKSIQKLFHRVKKKYVVFEKSIDNPEGKWLGGKRMNIRELEISKEMYQDAKRVENVWTLSEKNEYFDDIWVQDDKIFRSKYGNDFDTLEIINEYERRDNNTDRRNENTKNVYKITYIDDTTREYKFFSCGYNKENKLLIIDDIKSYYTDKIKKVECIEYNNNINYQ